MVWTGGIRQLAGQIGQASGDEQQIPRVVGMDIGGSKTHALAVEVQPGAALLGRHSGLVFELAGADDQVASQLVDRAAAALVEIESVVGTALGLTGPVVLAGGLLVHQPQLSRAVRERMSVIGFRDVRVLDRHPAYGALQLARQLALASRTR